MPNTLNPILEPSRGEKLIRGAKSDAVSFAFGIGTTPDASVMAVDKTKGGKALLELCKKESGAKKGAFGTVRFEEGTAVLACEHNAVSHLDKAVLAYFKTHKISVKVEVAINGAEVIVEEEGEATETSEGDKANHGGPARESWSRGGNQDSEASEEEDEGEEEDEDVPEGKIFDPAIIVPLIRTAKKRARPFAFGVGPDRSILAVHPKTEAVKLAKMVRAEGAKKGVWGMVQLDGSIAVFTCEKEPFAGVKKGIERWLKDQKQSLKFRIQGPEGEFIEEGDEGDEGEDIEAQGQQPSEAGDEQVALRRLESELAAMLPELKNLFAALPDNAAAIRANYAGCQAAIKAGNLTEAEGLLAALKSIGSGGKSANDLAAVKAELAALLPSLKVKAQDPAFAQRIKETWQSADAAVKAGHVDAAAKALVRLREIDAASTPPQTKPFQVFVKSSDGITFTLTLPTREKTLIGDLMAMVEDRTGISMKDQYLTAPKPINQQHAKLEIAEYNIQPNQTLMLQGRLKGGFGERAAIAATVLKDISHGNVLPSIKKTSGKSKALKDFSRVLTRATYTDTNGRTQTEPVGKAHLDAIVGEAVRLNLTTMKDSDKWLNDNLPFIKAIGTSKVQSGNCGDYTQVVYAELMTKTKNQFVYQVVMKTPYDHQFVVTSPTNHGTDVAALATDAEAVVADAWWMNTICAFPKFVGGENPYDEAIPTTNLAIVRSGTATGQPFSPDLEHFVTKKVEEALVLHETTIEKWTDENLKKISALDTAQKEVLKLIADVDDLGDEFKKLSQDVQRLDAEQQKLIADLTPLTVSVEERTRQVAAIRRKIDTADQDLRIALQAQNGPGMDQAITVQNEAIKQLNELQRALDADRQKVAALKTQIDVLNQAWHDESEKLEALKKAKTAYEQAEADLPGSFGDLSEPWDEKLTNELTAQEVAIIAINAFKKSGKDAFIDEMTLLSDAELKRCWAASTAFQDVIKNNVKELHGRTSSLGLA